VKPRVLVTTAAGRTGSVAAIDLVRRGHPVRGLVRRDDHRAQALRDAGVDVVVGDLFDWRDLTRALDDVQLAYHCPPFDSRHLHGATIFALAAEQAGVEVVALMSGWNPHQLHPSVFQREHWLANNLFRRQSFDVIHINPGLFAWTYFLGLPAITHFGVLALPLGNGRTAPPSNEDVGRVAAGALADPARFVGRCLRPTGPELITPSDAARSMSEALGRTVRYKAVSEASFVKAARAMRFPTFEIAQVRHYASEHRQGAFEGISDHVEEATGRAPESFSTIAARYLSDPTLVGPNMRWGSKMAAARLALRMATTRAIDLDEWEQTRDYPLIRNGLLAHENADWLETAGEGELSLLPERMLTQRRIGSEVDAD
jgi:uncharacterized protein YbjT (DUF2867 family)